jgi:hypothetical protein
MDKQHQTWAEVNVIVGGGMQSYAPASRADVVVLIDRQEEVAGVPDAPCLIGRRPLCHRGVLR